MVRYLLVLSIGIGLGIAGVAAAHHHKAGESVRVLAARDIVEKLDGKESAVSVVEVSLNPGEAGSPHRHPGPVFGYIVEGEYELGINDDPVQVFHVGETFYEPTGCLHRVSRNPSSDHKMRLIAVLLHPRDVKELAIPEHKEDKDQ